MTYVHLHNHTEFSALDGLSTCGEAVRQAAADGNPALAITDHGGCYGHPAFQKAADEAGIKPVFGMEAYWSPDRLQKTPYSHLVLLAADNQGLRDLWAASTESFVSGHHYKPRVDWELLERYGSRLFATSACLGGPVSQALLDGDYRTALARLERFKAIFGPRFFLEIQSNALPEQIRLNKLLVSAGEALGIPLVAASDAHYPTAAEAQLHNLWMACQAGQDKEDYWHYIHMHTEAETRAALGYLDPKVVDAAIRSTVEIAEQCNARIEGHAEPPVFTPGGTHDDDARRLWQLCQANWDKVARQPGQHVYRDRLAYEHELVAAKRMAGCYLMVHDVIGWTREQGRIIGPGRGSAAGSLMSYLCGITSMDPIPARLMFERFLTPGRDALPDFDMDFPSSFRPSLIGYMIRRYGEDRVIRVGTHMRYQAKGILNKLSSVMSSRLPEEWAGDFKRVSQTVGEAESHTAGLGLPWEEIMLIPELSEWQKKYAIVFDAASHLVGRLSSYGQHPAGLVVSTDASLGREWPMRTKDGGPLIGQWDYRVYEDLGLFKLDFLTLRTLDSIQESIDLIERRTGIRLDPPAWTAEHDDPQVWRSIGTGQTAGLFQVETSLGSMYCARHKPSSLAQLADLTTYMRPGPRNSGMTESYLARQAGHEPVSYPHPELAAALQHTYGVMLYQEDVISAVQILAGYDGGEADQVRRILGKKKTDQIEAAGRKFTDRAVERGHDREQVTALWEAMAEFARYGFNRAHAFAYGTLAFWTAWLKEHYPVETITAILSTLDKMDRMAVYSTEARRLGVRILPPDVNFCGAGFQVEGLAIRYGLSAIGGVGPVAIRSIQAAQPFKDYQDFVERAGVDAGVLYALAKAGALDSLVPSRRQLVRKLEADRDGSAVQCVHKDLSVSGENGLPCTYDWASEPVPVRISQKTGRELAPQRKPVPKTCRVSCRHYTPPEQKGLDGPEFAPDELWRTEHDIYGCWMSDAAFAQIDPRLGGGMRAQAREIALALPTARTGTYPLLGIHAGLRKAPTRTGSMHWLTLATEVSYLSLAVFSPRGDGPDLASALQYVKQGTLIGVTIIKDRYHQPGKGWRTSYRLAGLLPLGG